MLKTRVITWRQPCSINSFIYKVKHLFLLKPYIYNEEWYSRCSPTFSFQFFELYPYHPSKNKSFKIFSQKSWNFENQTFKECRVLNSRFNADEFYQLPLSFVKWSGTILPVEDGNHALHVYQSPSIKGSCGVICIFADKKKVRLVLYRLIYYHTSVQVFPWIVVCRIRKELLALR